LAVNVNSSLSTAFWSAELFRAKTDWTSPLPTKPLPVLSMVAALAAVAEATEWRR
jgi:hypothetical protein